MPNNTSAPCMHAGLLTASCRSLLTLGSCSGPIFMEVEMFSSRSTCSATGDMKFLAIISRPGTARKRLVFCWSRTCLQQRSREPRLSPVGAAPQPLRARTTCMACWRRAHLYPPEIVPLQPFEHADFLLDDRCYVRPSAGCFPTLQNLQSSSSTATLLPSTVRLTRTLARCAAPAVGALTHLVCCRASSNIPRSPSAPAGMVRRSTARAGVVVVWCLGARANHWTA